MKIINQTILIIACSKEEINKVVKSHPDSKFIFCGDSELIDFSCNQKIEFHNLYEFLPKNFESYIIEQSNHHIMKLVENPKLFQIFNIEGNDFLNNSRFALINIFYPIIKQILIIHNILDKFDKVDKTYVGNEYKNIYTSLQSGHYNQSVNLCKSIGLKILPIAVLLYKLFYLIPIGKFIGYKNSIVFSRINILIGNIHEFNQFVSTLSKSISSQASNFVIIHPMHKYKKNNALKKHYPSNYLFMPLDRFIKLNDIIFCIKHYITFIRVFKQTIEPELSIKYRNIEFKYLFLDSIIKFYYYNFLVSLKYYRITKRMMHKVGNKSSITFSYASTFQMNTMNNVFKENNVQTITFNHGLIQTPYQIPSETTLCLSESKYDLKLMKLFSHNDKYNYIKPLFAFNQLDGDFILNLKLLLMTNVFYANAPYRLTLDYVSKIIEFIKHLDINSCAIKPHPKEPKSLLTKHLKLIDGNIQIRQGEINEIINDYNFIITTYSTVILNCLKLGKPFLIYKTGFECNETFISQIPEEIIFSNKFEFKEKYNNLTQISSSLLNSIYEDVFNTYYFGVNVNY